MLFLYVIISLVIAAGLLAWRDLPIICGSTLASGAGERYGVRILCPLIILAGLALPAMLPGLDGIFRMPVPAMAKNILPVGIATLVAVLTVFRFSRFPAVSFAFMGALVGLGLATGDAPGAKESLPYIYSWLAAPLLCALLAAGIYRACSLRMRSRKTHMAVMEGRVLCAATLTAPLLLASAAYNNSPIFLCLLSGGGYISAAIAAICALAGWFCVRNRTSRAIWNIADYELDTNSLTILSLMLAMTLCFALFSSPIPAMAGLAATPLPAGTLYLAALLGISLVRRRALADGQEILLGGVAAVISPVLALMVAYCLGMILNGGLLGTAIVLGIALVLGGLGFFRRRQNRRTIREQLVRNRQEQVYSTQKALSALEVKAEMTERDLRSKLDLKRKELVDFAVGVSDQKEFMEKVYGELAGVRAMEDGPAKDRATDALLGSLRERMYFTREMNDFYARSEVLNEDFNMRLRERFPNLTDNERKLTNLLRQGFSSKYIASLMNITPKSAEIGRSRLRAKLGLKRSDNLINFIKAI